MKTALTIIWVTFGNNLATFYSKRTCRTDRELGQFKQKVWALICSNVKYNQDGVKQDPGGKEAIFKK